MQGCREFAAFPGFSGNQLQKRLAFDLLGRLPQRMGEARRDMRDPARCIGLPKPVGTGILKFLEQQAHDFAFLGETGFRDPSFNE